LRQTAGGNAFFSILLVLIPRISADEHCATLVDRRGDADGSLSLAKTSCEYEELNC